MTIVNSEFEWFNEKFKRNHPKTNLSVSFYQGKKSFSERIVFSLEIFDEHVRNSKYVMLGFNRELSILAIKPVEDKISGAYKISFPTLGRVVVTPGAFLREFGLNHSEKTTYEAEYDKDKQLLLVAIDTEKLVND